MSIVINLTYITTKTMMLKKENLSEELEAVWDIIEILTGSSLEQLSSLDMHRKIRSLLFFYGVIDHFCKASNLTKEQSDFVFQSLDPRIIELVDQSLLSLMKPTITKMIFNDSFLLDIITIGGESYGDFLSSDKEKGGMVLIRFGALLTLWNNIDPTKTESKIISFLKSKNR